VVRLGGRPEDAAHQLDARQLGYDVTCSCGQFETKTGGATRTYIEDELWSHRFAAQASED
jgi:hypothetical protein